MGVGLAERRDNGSAMRHQQPYAARTIALKNVPDPAVPEWVRDGP